MSSRRHQLYLKIGGKTSEEISWSIGRLTQAEVEQTFQVVRYREGEFTLPRGIQGAPTLVYFSGDGTAKKFEMEECVDAVNKIVAKIKENRQKAMQAGQPPRAAPPMPQQQYSDPQDGRRRDARMQQDSRAQQYQDPRMQHQDPRMQQQYQDPRMQQQDTRAQQYQDPRMQQQDPRMQQDQRDYVPHGDHRTVGSAGTEYVAPPMPAGRAVDSNISGARGVIFDDSLFRATVLGKVDGMHMFGNGIS